MRRRAGFTLLEVVVAFAIAGLTLALLTQAVAGGLRSSQIAARTEQALALARSRLAGLLDPRPGDQGGDDGDGFRWHVRIRPASAAPGDEAGAARPVLYAVTVEVSWGAADTRRAVTLDTLRIGRLP